MKAVAVFPRTREVKVIECEEPHITQPDQVKLRMLDVGVCGTDRLITSFVFGEPPAGEDALIIGHEALGQVVEVGASVRHLRLGDLATIRVARPCSYAFCRPCRLDQPDFCITDRCPWSGIRGRHGCMREFVVERDIYLRVVPPTLREVGVLIEPLSIAEKALREIWHIQQRLPWIDPTVPLTMRGLGLTAMVLGAGPVGLLGAMVLVNAGFHTYVYDLHPASDPRAEVIQEIGAHYISAQEVTSPTNLMRRAEPVDVVYEAAGSPQLAFEVLQELDACGIFVFVSTSLGSGIPVDLERLISDLVYRNKVVIGVLGSGSMAIESAIRDLETFLVRWPQALRTIISKRSPLEQAPAILSGPKEGIKQVIAISA